MTNYYRRITLTVTKNISTTPVVIDNVISARVNLSFDQRVSQASFVTQGITAPCGQDDEVQIIMGSATNGVNDNIIPRFRGYVREIRYTHHPYSVETICYGPLIKAIEYENGEDATIIGGMIPLDLTGTQPDTARNIINAVLVRCGALSSPSLHISSTATLYGTAEEAFVWSRGENSQNFDFTETGETAMSYIERYDEIDAVFTEGSPNTGGRYRTFESLNGVIYRILVGGRPRGTTDYTFTGGLTHSTATLLEAPNGINILDGAFERSTKRKKNYITVTGYDIGNGAGPEYATYPETPPDPKMTYQFNSPMIEKSRPELPTPATNGMDCLTVAGALSLEFGDFETVNGWILTHYDTEIGVGQTHLVQGAPAGLEGRLGVAEPLWVQGVEISVDEQGFRQRITYLGGGDPDTTLPEPPDLP